MLLKGVTKKNRGGFLGTFKRFDKEATWEKSLKKDGRVVFTVTLPRLDNAEVKVEEVSTGHLVTIPMDGLIYNRMDIADLDKLLKPFIGKRDA